MVNDPNVQTDGFIDLEGGMNSAIPSSSLPTSTCALGLNVTFRGGKVMTRPGFRQVTIANGLNDGLSYLDDYFQGASFYFNTASATSDRILVVSGGHVLVIFLDKYSVNRLFPIRQDGFADTAFKNNPLAEHHFCQAERFLVIQNGVDRPLIYDGNNLYYSGEGPAGSPGFLSSIPIGRHMAYNHGRLFVALQDGFQVAAGDLAYAGSTEQKRILISEAGESDLNAKITTDGPHGFSDGDSVYISGHTSDPDVNNDGVGAAYKIKVTVNSANTFTIPKEVKVAGRGGFAKKVSSGRDIDVLRFTEIQFLDEGGAFKVPASFGKITGLTFQAIGDTSSGQGDLIVFCEKGAATFQVSANRSTWKAISGFQKVLFPDIGCTSGKSLVNINSDVFWRSFDGIRSYANARKDTNNSYGYVPVSNEIRTIIEKDSPLYLNKVSSAFFDNRLLVTVSPRQDLRGTATIRNTTKTKPTSFQGLAVFDFASLMTTSQNRSAAWEGLWFSGDILQILSNGQGHDSRCFVFRQDLKPDLTENVTTLWELTKDLKYDVTSSGDNLNIISVLETKSFPFRSEFELKKLSKADVWIQELEGRCTMQFYYRPDQYPCWVDWHGFLECADNKSCINANITLLPIDPEPGESRYRQILSLPVTDVAYFRLGYGPWSTDPQYNKVSGILQFGSPGETPDPNPENVLSVKAALESIGFDFSNGGEVQRAGEGTLWSPYIYTIYTNSKYPLLSFYPTNDAFGSDDTIIKSLVPTDLQPQFRTQIRLPAPLDPPDDRACDPITKRPFRNGHEFQFRLKWEGFMKINKFLAYAYPLIEQIGSDCP